MKVVIIKYNAGNVQSVQNSLTRMGVESIVSADSELIQSADRVIFPGVGQAWSAMDYLKENRLDAVIRELKQPVLGICLGMQLLCKRSDEGGVDGLGLVDAEVTRFPESLLSDERRSVPHMGWNDIKISADPLFRKIPDLTCFYFVHSYFVPIGKETISSSGYGINFSAAIRKNNFYGVQFHPEKSGEAGRQVLANFLDKNNDNNKI